MGDLAASFVLADAISSIQRFVSIFIWVYTLMILAYILLSWFRLPYSPLLSNIQRFLHDVCNPYLRLFRRIVPAIGPLDLSPMVAIIVLGILNSLITAGLGRL